MKIVKDGQTGRNIDSSRYKLKVVEDELRLKPVKVLRLSELFDSIEVDVKDLFDTHELRRALYE
jgi:hypothetical protein